MTINRITINKTKNHVTYGVSYIFKDCQNNDFKTDNIEIIMKNRNKIFAIRELGIWFDETFEYKKYIYNFAKKSYWKN